MKRLLKADANLSMSIIAVAPGKDTGIGKLYPKEVPVPAGSFFVPAVTCSDFVFVAGQMATDENALDPGVRLPRERLFAGASAVRRQAEFTIKQRLEPALRAAGSTWNDVLKAQIYVSSADQVPEALEAWHRLVGEPCALTVVPAHGFGFVDAAVEINLLALRGGARRKKEVLKVDLPAMSMYGDVVRAGELVFPSGFMPVGFPAVDRLDGLARGTQVQALAALSAADKVCRAAGTSLSNIVRAQWFMTDATQFPGVELAWMGRLGRQPHPFGCVQVPGALPAPGAALTADFWIYAP